MAQGEREKKGRRRGGVKTRNKGGKIKRKKQKEIDESFWMGCSSELAAKERRVVVVVERDVCL